jgi:uncharacterized protein HemY
MNTTRIEQLAHRIRRARRAGETRKAILTCETLAHLDAETPRWWVILGYLQHRHGNLDEARKSLRQAIYLFRQQGELERRASTEAFLRALDEGETRPPPRHGNHGWRQARAG